MIRVPVVLMIFWRYTARDRGKKLIDRRVPLFLSPNRLLPVRAMVRNVLRIEREALSE
jgi:hypothetical protein